MQQYHRPRSTHRPTPFPYHDAVPLQSAQCQPGDMSRCDWFYFASLIYYQSYSCGISLSYFAIEDVPPGPRIFWLSGHIVAT